VRTRPRSSGSGRRPRQLRASSSSRSGGRCATRDENRTRPACDADPGQRLFPISKLPGSRFHIASVDFQPMDGRLAVAALTCPGFSDCFLHRFEVLPEFPSRRKPALTDVARGRPPSVSVPKFAALPLGLGLRPRLLRRIRWKRAGDDAVEAPKGRRIRSWHRPPSGEIANSMCCPAYSDIRSITARRRSFCNSWSNGFRARRVLISTTTLSCRWT
jgi:hypothetical protein